MLNYSNALLQKVAEKIEEDFGCLDDISQELANAITNLYAIALSPDEFENTFFHLLESRGANNIKSIAHVLSTMKTGELKKIVESLRDMSANGQPILKQYTEQFLIDTLKYGMDCRGLGGFPFIRSFKRQFLKPIIPEDGNLYQKIKLLRKLHEKNSAQDTEFINKSTKSYNSGEIEADRAICIKCGTFKSAALGRCSTCNFAPETSLDAAKSVLLTIEQFSKDELLEVSQNIKESGIGKVVFPADTIQKFVDTVEDKKSGRGVRSILEMNLLTTKRQGESVEKSILGWRYMQGQGVPQDDRKAFELWTESAKQGNAEAQFNLSQLYAQGRGVPQDYRKVVELLTKAAEQGLSIAQEVLGMLYVTGNGVEKDQSKGIAWLTKAVKQGSEEAESLLKELNALDAKETNAMKPDYGLHLIKNGLEKQTNHYIYDLKIDHLNRLDKNTLTTVANTISDGETYAASFDIPSHLFNALLEQFSEPTRSGVRNWLSDDDFCYEFDAPQVLKVIKITLGDLQASAVGSKEKFVPLLIQSFSENTNTIFKTGDRIFHGKFGYGKVIYIDGNKLSIEFDQVGNKKVMDSFIKLASE